MTSERKEPHLTDLDHAGNEERIPTLSERASPDLFDDLEEPVPADHQGKGEDPALQTDLAAALDDDAEAVPSLDDYDFVEELTREDTEAPAPAVDIPADTPEPEPMISPEQIEALSDRVLDQIAPALREAVTAAVTDLLAKRSRDTD